MIYSMTGFGEVEDELFHIRIKSVNHRFMNLSLKLSPALEPYEVRIRKLIQEKLQRGAITVAIRFKEERWVLDESKLQSFNEFLSQVKERLGVSGELKLEHFLPYLTEFTSPMRVERNLWPQLRKSLNRALRKVRAMQRKEGMAIYERVMAEIQKLRDILDEVRKQASVRNEAIKRRISTALETHGDEILNNEYFLSEKYTVDEEINRFASHVDELEHTLNEGGVCGKKALFLLQEMQRELNTLGAKAKDDKLVHLVVDLKLIVESMHEELENIK